MSAIGDARLQEVLKINAHLTHGSCASSLEAMPRFGTNAVRGLCDLLFPPVCEHCLGRATAQLPLCWRCVRLLERVDGPTAERVLSDLPIVDGTVSIRCLWYFDRDGPLRDVVHALKYGNRPWYGQFLGRSMAEAMLLDLPADVVVALPLHPLRRLERGYNQATWIASELARHAGATFLEGVLQRVKPTHTQTSLSRVDRWANVRNAFAVSCGVTSTLEHVALIDDVVTTGATAVSAALALKRAGARKVTIVAAGLARA